MIFINKKNTDYYPSVILFPIAIGSIIGIIVAYIIVKASVKFNLGLVFKALGIIFIYLGGELFGEGLVKIVGGGEVFETVALIVFIIPSLFIFLKKDLQK
ncbi:hypothetical protein H5P36_23075 [Bacillus sp. APMAM]|nr:hypothetical protein [Bacillus sp. APMAM]RTZ53518.1 hypothetical protein EKO25_22850 [Bacillus sp. SAJ1]